MKARSLMDCGGNFSKTTIFDNCDVLRTSSVVFMPM